MGRGSGEGRGETDARARGGSTRRERERSRVSTPPRAGELRVVASMRFPTRGSDGTGRAPAGDDEPRAERGGTRGGREARAGRGARARTRTDGRCDAAWNVAATNSARLESAASVTAPAGRDPRPPAGAPGAPSAPSMIAAEGTPRTARRDPAARRACDRRRERMRDATTRAPRPGRPPRGGVVVVMSTSPESENHCHMKPGDSSGHIHKKPGGPGAGSLVGIPDLRWISSRRYVLVGI